MGKWDYPFQIKHIDNVAISLLSGAYSSPLLSTCNVIGFFSDIILEGQDIF